jgi:transcriptional regulator GlxA family with amidase domain
VAITLQYTFDQIGASDLIPVSSGAVHLDRVLKYNRMAVPWLRQWHGPGHDDRWRVLGGLPAREAGILDGKEATTHWGIAERFRHRCPKVHLRPDRLVTDADTVLCAGGVNAGLDLSLYLVEKYCGRDVALQCAKSLLIETSRTSQAGFAVLAFNKRHSDKAITQAQDWLEGNYRQEFSMDGLASRHNMSSRNFMRCFKAATDGTPLAYLHQLWVVEAKHAIEAGNAAIETICNEVGYEDVAFFRSLFRRYVGVTPKAYREEFGTHAAR